MRARVLTQNLGRRARASRSTVGVAAAAMPRPHQILRLLAMMALGSAVAACSSDLGLNNVTLVPKPETLLRKPDWATFSGGKSDFVLRPVTAGDLVNAAGQCAGEADQAGNHSPTSRAAPVTRGAGLRITGGHLVRRPRAP